MLSKLFSILEGVFVSYIILDKRVWILESSGRFSSKSFFMSLHNDSPPSYSFPFKRIWSNPVPLRVKAFVWTASLERINTMNMVQ